MRKQNGKTDSPHVASFTRSQSYVKSENPTRRHAHQRANWLYFPAFEGEGAQKAAGDMRQKEHTAEFLRYFILS